MPRGHSRSINWRMQPAGPPQLREPILRFNHGGSQSASPSNDTNEADWEDSDEDDNTYEAHSPRREMSYDFEIEDGEDFLMMDTDDAPDMHSPGSPHARGESQGVSGMPLDPDTAMRDAGGQESANTPDDLSESSTDDSSWRTRSIIVSGSESEDVVEDASDDESGYEDGASDALASLHVPEVEFREDVEDLVHEPAAYTKSPFHAAMSLWQIASKIGRADWGALVEVLKTCESLDDLHKLPKYKPTLGDNFAASFPLLSMKRRKLELNRTALPNRSDFTEHIYSFDMKDVFARLASSPKLRGMMHQGLARLTDKIEHVWESRCWGESPRAWGGECPHYPDGRPMLASDFVRWECSNATRGCDCGHEPHFGRVLWVGRDCTADAQRNGRGGKIVIRIQRVYTGRQVPDKLKEIQQAAINKTTKFPTWNRQAKVCRSMPKFPPCEDSEDLFIVEDKTILVLESQVRQHVSDVYLDYRFKREPSQPRKYKTKYVVRFIVNIQKPSVRPLRFSTPHRGELEIAAFTREWLIEKFMDKRVISLPYFLYSDGFGIYRKMHRSIMGIYAIPAFYHGSLKDKRASILPISLGPFGASQEDIFGSLFHLGEIDRGCSVRINGQDTFLCAFPLAFIGDMPQQAKLTGCLEHGAEISCRFCLVPRDRRGDLDFDVHEFGRYHHDMQFARNRAQSLPKDQRDKELKSVGLNPRALLQVVSTFTPALDIFHTRPPDFAHSEYKGLSEDVLELLTESILFPAAVKSLALGLQGFAMPPGWKRIPNIETHLKSFSMQECCRAAIIIPIYFLNWLQRGDIRPMFGYRLSSIAPKFLDVSPGLQPVEYVILALWTFARSLLATGARAFMRTGVTEFFQTVVAGRRAFQLLCETANDVARSGGADGARPNEGSISPGFTIFNRSRSPSQSSNSSASLMPKKPSRFQRMQAKPNIHVALHFPDTVLEYGPLKAVCTLGGEDFHRKWTGPGGVSSTNNRQVAGTLLQRENLNLTLWMLLNGCFDEDEDAMARVFKKIAATCPALLNVADPGLSARFLEDTDLDAAQIPELGGKKTYEGDESHWKPQPRLRVKLHSVEARDDQFLSITRPARTGNQHPFCQKLLEAYHVDYKKRSYNLGTSVICWYQQILFTNQKGRRISISVGEHVKVREDRIARVEAVFTHGMGTTLRLFAVVCLVGAKIKDDDLLELPMYKFEDSHSIVGLPAISDQRVWLVPCKGYFMDAPHDLFFM